MSVLLPLRGRRSIEQCVPLASLAPVLPDYWFSCTYPTITTDLEDETMTQLMAWFVWLALLVSAIQSLYFTWLCWPRLRSGTQAMGKACYRKLHCVWCWKALHIKRWYPQRWSSTLCLHHRQVEMMRWKARRAAYLATRPTVVAITVVEVEAVCEQREVLA